MINISNFDNYLLNNNNNYNNIQHFNILFFFHFFLNYFFVKCSEEYVSWKNAVLPYYFNAVHSLFIYMYYDDLLHLTKCARYVRAHCTNILYPTMQYTLKIYFFLFWSRLPEDNTFLHKIDFKMQSNHSIVSKMTNWTALTCNMVRSWWDNVAFYYLECSSLHNALFCSVL